jgi:HlyD family secretion protein
MKKIIFLSFAIALTLLSSCGGNQKTSDAYGNFEATKITISSEANGKILNLNIDEGKILDSNQVIGLIDTLDLYYKKEQLLAQISTLQSNFSNVASQKAVLEQQKANIQIDKNRIEKLLKSGAATQKQMDDISGSMNVIDKQILSTESQNQNITNQIAALQNQVKSIQLAINKCVIINPMKGVVLNQLAYVNEITGAGKPLYTIADLSYLELKIYVSGDQLANIKLGQEVEVLIDSSKKETKKLKGIVSWISENAEFTPKTIQTKEERVNYVYAAKVKVLNESGELKIGMPGEVNF